MTWINENLVSILILLGLSLLAIEVLVLGFSIFIIFFFGLGSLLTGILIYTGILPETIVSALLGVAVLSSLSALLLWKQLKKLQNNGDSGKVKRSFIEYSFVLESDISSHSMGSHRYSGIEWDVKSEEEISAGTEVEVTLAEVGVLTVKMKGKDAERD